jgi:hypothetical protein
MHAGRPPQRASELHSPKVRVLADRLRRMRSSILALALLCTGCTWFKGNQEVLITSEPPGAHIWLDGRDTGETTPHSFDIAGNFGFDHPLELKKKGYRSEQRILYQHTRGYTSRWIDGAGPPGLPPWPFAWTMGDIFFPFGVKGAIVPGELYVKLYREDEPLLGFDVLREREQQAAARAAEAK